MDPTAVIMILREEFSTMVCGIILWPRTIESQVKSNCTLMDTSYIPRTAFEALLTLLQGCPLGWGRMVCNMRILLDHLTALASTAMKSLHMAMSFKCLQRDDQPSRPCRPPTPRLPPLQCQRRAQLGIRPSLQTHLTPQVHHRHLLPSPLKYPRHQTQQSHLPNVLMVTRPVTEALSARQ